MTHFVFLHLLIFCFASCLCRVNFYGRNSMGLTGVVSLISLSGCSRFALSTVSVGSFVVFGFLPFRDSFVGGFFPPASILRFTAPTYSCMWPVAEGRQNGLRQQESILWDFKVPASREEIGDSLGKYSFNWYSTQLAIFFKREVRLLGEEDCEMNPEHLCKVRWWDILRVKDRK